jgi:hypothetical protein
MTRASSLVQPLEGLNVGHYVSELRSFQDFFELRHKRVAILNPRFQRFIGNFIGVDGEGAALRNPLQARANFLGVTIRVMAHRAFFIEDFLAAGRSSWRILRAPGWS